VHSKAAPTGRLLHTAVVAVGILELQTHLGSVFLEVEKLFGVEGSTSLPAGGRGEHEYNNIHRAQHRKHYGHYWTDHTF